MREAIARNLTALAEQNNTPQTTLAEVSGTSQAFISYVMDGKKIPSIEVLDRLAKFFGVTVDDLIKEGELS